LPSRSHRQRGLSNAGAPNQPRRQRQISRVDHQPTGKHLMQHFLLTNPFTLKLVSLTQVQLNALNLNLLALCSLPLMHPLSKTLNAKSI
jgi:hypothetical protein